MTEPVTCPIGTFSNDTGLMNDTECESCTPGKAIVLFMNKPNQNCKIYNALWEILSLLGHLTFDISRLVFLIIMHLSIIAII